ncbi:hypothetical protein, partial [Shouchella clausii]|uniref:hypothetical protein n=1 Tax=Shouchella clausii TaxID=79880 RepID=UPI001C52E12A
FLNVLLKMELRFRGKATECDGEVLCRILTVDCEGWSHGPSLFHLLFEANVLNTVHYCPSLWAVVDYLFSLFN